MAAKVGIDEFIGHLVKTHLKQVDPEAAEDIEAKTSMGTSEITFLVIVLALTCYIIADFVYPYIFTEKAKKRKAFKQAVQKKYAEKKGR
mmetsp:Transcript_56766/g.99247  ORF Transcript_56766/g.99247 Transcript_56766/m.99247 type:complete len:89 (-) Transcript_56766:32-298(-)